MPHRRLLIVDVILLDISRAQLVLVVLLVVLIVMSYACMAPLILLPGMLFFGVASVVYRHQFLFVYIEDHESGGLFWPKIYRRIIFSLFVFLANVEALPRILNDF